MAVENPFYAAALEKLAYSWSWWNCKFVGAGGESLQGFQVECCFRRQGRKVGTLDTGGMGRYGQYCNQELLVGVSSAPQEERLEL